MAAPGLRTKKKEERMRDILDAALALFSKNGFEAARLDDVAVMANISKGTIYLYFDSKEALFEAVIRDRVLPHIEEVEDKTFEKGISCEDMLRQTLTIFYTKVASQEDLRKVMHMLIAEGPRFPHLLEFYYTDIISRGMTAFSRIIEAGIKSGEFRDTGLQVYAHMVIAPTVMGALWKVLFDRFSPLDLDELREKHIELLINGLTTE